MDRFASIDDGLLRYNRSVSNNNITTSISINQYYYTLLKNIYKNINKNVNLVGLDEIAMAIIRKGVIEPIEFYFSNNNIFLLHASGVVINQKGVVFIGGVSGVNPTLFNYIYNNKLADQYFI